MHLRSIIRIMGILVMCFSLTMLVPAVVALIYGDGEGTTFVKSFLISISVGFLFWWSCRYHKDELRSREGFLIVVAFWFVLGCIAALPLFLANSLDMSTADVLFESFSALTTTGATVMSGLDELPKAILFHRQFTQFVGGMGIIVLAVAVIPLLGVGGTQLYKAESSGPLKDQKILPRIAEIAKLLWLLYSFMILACALSYWLAGMSVFDAIGHSFSTISNGGFSTHDANMGFFQNSSIHIIATVFMLIAGCNFSLHILAAMNWRKGQISKIYFGDPEFRFFVLSQLFFISLFSIGLYLTTSDYSFAKAFELGSLQLVSMSMTAGFTIFDFNELSPFLGILLLFSAAVGGCAGSTSGGLKAIRVLVLWLQVKRELKQLVHPSLVNSIKLDKSALPIRIIESIWAFFIVFILVFFGCTFVAMLFGMEAFDALGGVWATITNAGPGIGMTSLGFADTPDGAKYVFIFAMVAGRLEFFSLLVLFTPAFWKT
ncbi:TrkH family potassium uptake protein [Pasteurella atlantica]|uniref:TrkH family potassium uptake protein n=1 Tax=Pasteurellaceae TaxID=712 RepID=UPI00276FE11F|nr:TrkH family potassium uptake protein [Pasteurella atlantica]MDP8032861.1 TrkH family potassium uptake protein [Pasteurella atlantica]MDP8034633.1 TrkH family potassium uptake protein [Pasteurella atlantica]MDP8036583.1 TrkH family potassium uptake protein [Pasteurella atlantica]MDP8047095.1 TrkH family potassium uptake protein [Pasteurella atlantica]MDP8049048.1 TrkH family potassium uptake protein [Pasteurella atlantica]